MKKKTFVALLLSILAVFCIFTLVACNGQQKETEEPTDTTGVQEETEKPTETESDTESGEASDSDASETTETTETEYTGPCLHEETEIVPAVAPTCTKTGTTEGSKCVECGKAVVNTRLVAAVGHTYDIDAGKCIVEGCPEPEIVFAQDSLIVYELNEAKDGYIVKGFAEGKSSGILAVPATYKDLPVVAIADSAFAKSSLTNVIVSRGMLTIGKDAFKGSLALREVLLSDTVATVGEGAFNGCVALVQINLRNVSSIGKDALAGCTKLTKILVDETNTAYISLSGILYTKAADAIVQIPPVLSGDLVIPDGITELAANAFKGATGITSVTFGTGLKKVGANAFNGCSGIKKVTAPSLEAWLAIEFDGMFATPCYYTKALYIGDTKLSGAITIPNGAESVGAWVFANLPDITSVTIPAGVKSIGANAFYACKGLTTVTLPEGVEVIGDSAFYYCENIAEVVIPASVKTIGVRAFKGCSSLKSIKFGGSKTEWNAIAKGNFWDDNTDYTVTFAE